LKTVQSKRRLQSSTFQFSSAALAKNIWSESGKRVRNTRGVTCTSSMATLFRFDNYGSLSFGSIQKIKRHAVLLLAWGGSGNEGVQRTVLTSRNLWPEWLFVLRKWLH
jgi:hypothetical protein